MGNANVVGSCSPVAEGGIASILAMAGNLPGEIMISASADGLQSDSLLISLQ
jgi:hypothetical protein